MELTQSDIPMQWFRDKLQIIYIDFICQWNQLAGIVETL